MKLSYNRINVITLLNDLVAKSLSTCADRRNSEQFGSGRRKCEHSDAIGAMFERTQCASSREMASIGGAAFSRERRVRVSRTAIAQTSFWRFNHAFRNYTADRTVHLQRSVRRFLPAAG